MEIISLELNNFVSYYGVTKLDFSSDTGNSGYAFFGEEGRGKTTLPNAIRWCLFGEVEASRLINGQMLTKKRPVIDAKQYGGDFKKSFPAPLLNDQAYYDSDFSMHITLRFSHEDVNGKENQYVLKREIKPVKPKPVSDKYLSIKAHLSVDGSTVATARIPETIAKIIPPRVANFFFIEMDSIEKYAALLWGDSSDLTIREDVDSILGVPALERSQEDFESFASKAAKEVTKKKKSATDDPVLLQNIKKNEIALKGYEESSKEIEGFIDELNKDIDEITINIENEGSAENLLNDQKTQEQIIVGCKDEIKELYESRRKHLSGNIWLALLQGNLSSRLEHLRIQSSKYKKLFTESISLDGQVKHNQASLESETVVCEHCNQTTQLSTPEEREAAKKFLTDNLPILERMKEDLENKQDPHNFIDKLTEFKAIIDYDRVNEIEQKIGSERVKIRSAERKHKKLAKQLENHDIVQIATWQAEKTTKTKQVGSFEDTLNVECEAIEETNEELARLNAQLSTDEDSVALTSAIKRQKFYQWLSDSFDEALSEYRESARKSVEARATEAFLAIFPDAKRYKKIVISDDWEMELIKKSGKPKTVVNPGHKQTIAVSLFDGLRHTSKHRFPSFFDNPGSNVGDETKERMTAYFLGIEENQTILLSHSGGLKQEETIESFGDRLAKAWRLSYAEDDDNTLVEQIL